MMYNYHDKILSLSEDIALNALCETYEQESRVTKRSLRYTGSGGAMKALCISQGVCSRGSCLASNQPYGIVMKSF